MDGKPKFGARISILPPIFICEAAPPGGLETVYVEYAMCPFCGQPLSQHTYVPAQQPPPIPIERKQS